MRASEKDLWPRKRDKSNLRLATQAGKIFELLNKREVKMAGGYWRGSVSCAFMDGDGGKPGMD